MQIRTKWKPHNGINDESSSEDTTTYSKQSRKKKWCNQPRPLVMFLLILLGVVSIAGIVATAIILAMQEPADNLELKRYEMTASVINLQYTDALADTTSYEFRNISQTFCDELLMQTTDSRYRGCVVNELRNGSVIVRFTIFIIIPTSTPALTRDEIIVIVGLEIPPDRNSKFLNYLEIGIPTVQLLGEQTVREEEAPRRLAYQSPCTLTSDCVTKLSSCVLNRCLCRSDRVHNSNTDSCEEIDCGNLPTVSNGEVTSDGTGYGSTLTVTCDSEYEISGTSDSVVCTQSGSWGNVPQCIPITCPEYIPSAVHNFSESSEHNTTIGSVIKLTCIAGYTLNGDDTITCRAVGNWSTAPACVPNACVQYVPESGSHKSAAQTQGSYKDLINITCANGYTFANEDVTTEECQEDGTWTSRVVCQSVTCDTYQLPEHAIVATGSLAGNAFGDTIVVGCNTGYTVQGSPEVSCQADGTWSISPSCVPVNCPIYSAPDGSHKESTSTVPGIFMEELTIVCETGYQLKDENTKTEICQNDGTWTSRVECTPIACEEYTPPQHAIVISGNATDSFYPDTLTLNCESGYEVTGEATVSCQIDGSWTKDGSCEPRQCSNYQPGTGSHKIATTTSGVFMDIINITCANGYRFEDDSVTTEECQADGTWTDTVQCGPVPCLTYEIPQHATLVSGSLTASSFNDSITLTCVSGYEVSGDDTVFCLSDGTWTQSPICLPIQCITYTPPLNTFKSATVTEGNFMDEINMTCDVGYEFENTNVTKEQCLADGNWTNRVVCNIISCEEYQPPPKSHVVETTGSRYQDTIVLACDEGFELEQTSQITVTCNADKTWSPDFTCEKISCGSFTYPAMSTVNQSGSLFEETITVICNPGYNITGASEVTCQSNGEWGSPGTCDAIDCDPFNPPVNSTDRTTKQVKFNEVIDVRCNDGYVLVGMSPVQCFSDGSWPELTCTQFDCLGDINVQNSSYAYINLTSVSINCYMGYSIIGNSIVNCINGTWEDSPTCEIVDCGAYPNVPNGSISDLTSTTYSTTVTISCNEGFRITDEMNGTVTCEETGNWSSIISCSIVNCGQFISPSNGYVVESNYGTEFGTEITIMCNEGFNMSGGGLVTCMASGIWSTAPTCQIVDCGSPQIENGIYDVSQTTFNSSIDISCELGNRLEGESQITCQASGLWTTLPVCNMVSCGNISTSTHETITMLSGNFYGNSLSIMCDDGYLINGNSSATFLCGSDGNWNKASDCEPRMCQTLEIPANAILVNTSTSDYVFGDVVILRCQDGYNIFGSGTVMCLSDGSWALPACVRCSEFSIENGSITFMTSNGSASCDEGFDLNGESTIVCQQNGEWSSTPACTIKDCSTPPDVEHGVVVLKSNSTTYEATAELQCNVGYIANENQTITCLSTGEWSSIGFCSMITCEPPGIPRNGSIRPESVLYNFNDVVNVSCDLGYTIDGMEQIWCLADGNWTALPSCEPVVCETYVPPDNSFVVDSQPQYIYKDIISITCSAGFFLDGLDFVECQANGTWTTSATCNPVNCGTYSQPENGDYLGTSTTFGSIVQIICNTGYQTNGTVNSTCQASGNWSKTGTCVPLDCGQFSIPNNSEIINSDYSSVYGSVVSFRCAPGYSFVNDSVTSIECLNSGEWSELPDCEPERCVLFETPANASLLNSTTQIYVYMDVVYVQCASGFFQNGSGEVECMVNGMWSPLPSCVFISCSALEVANATITYTSLMNATVVCDSKFDIVGDPIAVCRDDSTWTTVPVCNLARCGDLILPVGMKTNNTEYQLGTEAYIYCDTGYMLGGSSFAMCNTDGEWQINGFCDRINCGEYNLQDNSVSVSSNSTYFNATIIINCIEGFELSDGSSNTVICGISGIWLSSYSCIRISCPLFELPPNASFTGTVDAQYVLNDTVSVECNPGFNLSSRGDVMCQANGTWTTLPTCLAVTCSLPDSPVNGSFITNQETYFFNDTIEIICNEGFELNDTTVITCTQNGSWNVSPSCVPVICENFTAPNNAVTIGDTSNRIFEETLELNCLTGYILNGPSVVECLANRTWSQKPTCEIIDCADFTEPASGTVTGNSTTFGSVVNIQCRNGYLLEGLNSSICLDTGDWSESGKCVPVDCGNFTSPVYSSVSGNYSTTFGSTVDFTCNVGYTFVGSETSIVCTENGTWSQLPECTGVSCDKFPVPANATSFNSTDAQYVYLDKVKVECNMFFKMIGESTVTCEASGNWSSIPTCELIECPDLTIPNANITYNSPNNVSVTCDDTHALDGPISVLCMENGTWTEIPSCILQACGLLQTSPVYVVNDTDHDAVGTVISFGCNEGYVLNGSETVTCMPDLQWTTLPTCEIVNCGPNNITDSTYIIEDGPTVYNSTLSASCVTGMVPVMGSATSVYCNANGTWTGSPACEIQGTVSFSQNSYTVEVGSVMNLPCRVTSAVEWQTVVLYKWMNMSATEIAVVDKDTGVTLTDPSSSYMVTADTVSSDNVTVYLGMAAGSCAEEGVYGCWLVAGDKENPVDTVQANTSVVVIDPATEPILQVPDTAYAGRPVTIQCTANVGKSADGTFGLLSLEIRNATETTFDEVKTVNGTQCGEPVVLSYTATLVTDVVITCTRRSPDNDIRQSTRNVTVVPSYVTFTQKSYVLNAGQQGNITCQFTDVPDWRSMSITRPGGTAIFDITRGTEPVVTGDHITSEATFDNSSGTVTLIFDPVTCSGDGQREQVYECYVTTNDTRIGDTANITFQRLPDKPSLTLSYQIVQGQTTWLGREFVCDGNLGYPPGHMEIQADFTGEFKTIFSLTNSSSEIGFINVNVTDSNDTTCSTTQTLKFALELVPLDYHRKKLRCAIFPSVDVSDQTVVYSDPGTIKVLENTFCVGKLASNYKHPYYCDLYVECLAGGGLSGVHRCGSGQCFDGSSCANCDAVQCSGIICSSPQEGPVGSDVTFDCDLISIDNVTSISVDKDSQNLVSSPSEAVPLTSVDVDQVNARIDANVAEEFLQFMFMNVSCNVEGQYTLQLNNLVGTEENLQLYVMDAAEAPVIVNVTESPKVGQELQVTCMGNVGRLQGQPQHDLRVQIMFANDTQYTDLSDVPTTSTNCTDCTCVETSVFSLYPTATWNVSSVRCVTFNGSLAILASPDHVLILTQGLVEFLHGDRTLLVGETLELHCQLSGSIWSSGVSVTRSIDGLTESLCTVDAAGAGTCGTTGFIANGTVTGDEMTVNVYLAGAACLDSGQYLCGPTNDANTRSAVTVTVIRLPDQPTLTLSRQIIEDQGTLRDRPFSCSAQLGYPPGHIEIQADFSGNFTTVLSPTNEDNDVSLIIDQRNRVETKCNVTESFEFGLKAAAVTLAIHNSRLRCVVIPAPSVPDQTPVYTEEIIYVLNKTFCVGRPDGFYYHPYSCRNFIQCVTSGSLAGVINCAEGLCFNGIDYCEDCNSVVCNVETPTTTTTTTTTEAPTTTTTTVAPGVERISCSPDTLAMNGQTTVTSQCTLQNVESITKLEVLRDGSVYGEREVAGGITGQVDFTPLTLDVTSTAITVSFAGANVTCADEGTFVIRINNGTTGNSLQLWLISDPGVPALIVPQSFTTNQVAEVSCTGNVGRQGQSVPRGYVTLQVMFESELTFSGYSQDVATPSNVTCADCTCSDSTRYEILMGDRWNNASIRCVVRNTTDVLTESTVTTITLSPPLISFVGGRTQAAVIGSSKQIECRAENGIGNNGLTLAKVAGNNTFTCAVTGGSTATCGSANYDLSGTLASDVMTAVLTIPQVVCEDAGQYECFPSTDSSSKAVMELNVTKDPVILEFSLPRTLVQGSPTRFDEPLNCKADMGYPDSSTRDLRIEYRSQGNTDYQRFTLKAPTNSDGSPVEGQCALNKTFTYNTITFTAAFNDSVFRCSVYENETSAVPLVSSNNTSLLLLPGTICPTDVADGYFYHPYDCHLYIRCVSGAVHVNSCNAGCPDIANGVLTSCVGQCNC